MLARYGEMVQARSLDTSSCTTSGRGVGGAGVGLTHTADPQVCGRLPGQSPRLRFAALARSYRSHEPVDSGSSPTFAKYAPQVGSARHAAQHFAIVLCFSERIGSISLPQRFWCITTEPAAHDRFAAASALLRSSTGTVANALVNAQSLSPPLGPLPLPLPLVPSLRTYVSWRCIFVRAISSTTAVFRTAAVRVH